MKIEGKALRVIATLLIGLSVGGTAVAHQNDEQTAASAQTLFSADYVIGARDLLEVRVFDHADLTTEARVSEAGTITLPLVGEMVVAGLTRSNLEVEIATNLARYIREPQVFVAIKQFQSQRYSVMGAVGTPGTFEMEGRTTLLEALSNAGGVNFEGANGTISIIRQGFTQEPIEVDMEELIEGGNTAYNIELAPFDIVNVEPKRTYSIYVYGQVTAPGQFEVTQELTLLQAISLAGGLGERAASKRIRIMRSRADGRQEVIEVNLEKIEDGKDPDVRIRPGDIILVPSTFF